MNCPFVLTSFKLLGVTIDNKLTFTEHCSNIKKIVNWKMYSIKRLFNVLQLKFNFSKRSFFPTLIIAFHSLFIFLQQRIKVYAIASIACNCLYKPFNFKPEYNSEEEDEEIIMSDFLVKLQSYQLFTVILALSFPLR